MGAERLDLIAIKERAESYITGVLEYFVPRGKWDGNEYIFLNPARADSKLGSCKFNRLKMTYYDFANGDKGDIIDLVRVSRNIDLSTALKEIADYIGEKPTLEKKFVEKKEKVRVLDELPPAPAKKFTHFKFGEPSAVWEHKDENGALIGYICRFDTDKGKQDLPYYWGEHVESGNKFFIFKGLKKPRKLFGLETLSRKSRSIIIVEGQKCASALSNYIPLPVITWTQGTNGIDYSDWEIIKNDKRNIIYWADNDAPGKKTINVLQKILQKDIEVVEIPKDKPKGWDCADMIVDGATVKDVVEFIKTQKKLLTYLPDFKEKTQEKVEEKNNEDENNFPFKILGYDSGRYYYFPEKLQQVRCYSASEHTQSNLLELAPLVFWETNFPKSNGGVDWGSALNCLIRLQEVQGIYRSENIRGRGVWIDNGRHVVHAGNYLVIDEKKHPLKINSKYAYERAKSLDLKLDTKLSNAESLRLYELINSLSWEREEYAKMLAGWCTIAPIAGCLKWRPHIWLTAGAGTGKSWVLTNIIKPLIGEHISALGESTQAGIRQATKNDALPIVIDEFESNDKRGNDRVNSILELARQSSSEGEASILKGTVSHRSVSFKPRGIFCFASIGVAIREHADETRISVLKLKKNKNNTDFEKIERECYALINDDIAGKLIARTIDSLPVLMQNIEKINKYITLERGKRYADQHAPLYAGAWSLRSNKLITDKEIEAFVDLSSKQDDADQKDEERCLELILESTILHKGKLFSVAELIDNVIDYCEHTKASPYNVDENEKYDAVDCFHSLSVHGIRVVVGGMWEATGECERAILIANKHKEIDKMLADSSFCGKHKHYLERMKNVEKNISCRFAGTPKRAIKIKID